jgi:Zn-dependent protease
MDELSRQLPQPVGTMKPKKGKGIGAAITGIGVLLLKFAKIALPLLKTAGSMFVMIWLYSMNWGWSFALGFAVMILIHECGHVIVAKFFGLPVSAPLFIPFVGAMITLKRAPKDAWMEACVGIGGPVFGTVGALGSVGVYFLTGNPLYLAIAYSACFLNLFNLIPITPLDGGRIAAAISPWLWAAGLAILVAALWLGWLHFNFVILAIIALCGLRVFRLMRGRSTETASYFSVSVPRRCLMGAMYIGLVCVLAVGMSITRVQPPHAALEQYSLKSLRPILDSVAWTGKPAADRSNVLAIASGSHARGQALQ